ncbi:MAG: hypothetical protein IJX77_01010 [Ruminococcus sp.]|nr:hypothetical protein [Ruminococcus sp.]
MKKANTDIRAMMKGNRVPAWAVASVLGVHENTVLRKLRFELPEQDKQTFRRIISELSECEAVAAESEVTNA